ncbi:MAG: type II toxin-antitoxin system RelE/ParE family toxin [Acidobacteria bacterium]|nr:type II toxin-antitoxin system RelE/ParE family toxin [Acidobacteriota bacterium]
MTVEFHPAAFTEAEEAQAWYLERSVLAASAFLQELSRAIQQIRQAPHRYAVAEAGTRKILIARFPFTIYYRHTSNVLTIVAVAHQKRRPGYWRNR